MFAKIHKLIIFHICEVIILVANRNVEAGFDDSSYATPPNVDTGEGEENVVLWWTPFTGIQGESRTCSLGNCYFTENREYMNDKRTKVLLFYGSDFNVEDLPLPRLEGQWWGLLHEESPKNQPLFDHEAVLSLFNVTSTFRRQSNFPLTLQHLESIDGLTSTEEFLSLPEKSIVGTQEQLAPVVYVQSDCDTLSERDSFVQELSKYIKVDSYGTCLHNRDLPDYLHDAAANYDHHEFREIIAKYKFALAIENAACEDYITEKLWRPLRVGTVPIYWGSPSVNDWIPNPKSVIDIREFDSPQHLAQHLHTILQNHTLYNSHLEHKIDGVVSNKNLISAMNNRMWGINNDFEKGNFIEHFECYVCDLIISSSQLSEPEKEKQLQADSSHYGCPEPPTVLTGRPNPKSFWVEEWHKARLEAQVLHRLISTPPGVFTTNQYFAEVIENLQNNRFFHKFQPVHEEL